MSVDSVCGRFGTAWRGGGGPAGRTMMAIEIATHPLVLRHARVVYERNATLSVTPTAKGRVEIDAYHELAVR